MKRAILFLLVICSLTGIALAQVEDSPSEQEPEQEIQNSEQPQANDGHVEKDPDELGADAPFQVGIPPVDNKDTPVTIQPAPENNNTTATTDENAPPAANSGKDPRNFMDTAQLQGLNKITARTSKLEVKLGDSIKFGNLKITLHACWKSPPEEETDNKALLEMWEEIPGEPRSKIFSGWMFSSSPLISAPEHPVYDITVLACTGNVAGKAAKKEAEKTPEKASGEETEKPADKKPSKKK